MNTNHRVDVPDNQDDLDFDVFSASRTVLARSHRDRGIAVEVHADALREHTPQSLREEIEDVIAEAHLQRDEIAQATRRTTISSSFLRRRETSATRQQRDKFERALATVDVAGASKRGYVTMRWTGELLLITWEKDPLNNLSLDELNQEINDALARVTRARTAAVLNTIRP